MRQALAARAVDWTEPLIGVEHAAAQPITLEGGRHLAIIATSNGKARVLGEFGNIHLDDREVLLLAPSAVGTIQHAPGHRVLIGLIHERLTIDLLQWRHRTAGGKVDVWQHLRTRTPPYWRATVTDQEHGLLLSALRRGVADSARPQPVWQQVRTVVEIMERVDAVFARSFEESPFVRVSRVERPARLRKEVARAKAYIEKMHMHPLSVPDIATHVGLSPSALSRAFSRELGVTAPEYLRAVRMSRFERLLAETDKSIQEIAGMVGLSSTGHLREHIAEKYGVSTRELRRRLRQSA
jgi:AraC-like DNA-binding protein